MNKLIETIILNQKLIEETPLEQYKALRAYKNNLDKKVASFREDTSEFFKSFFNAFCYKGDQTLRREIIECWDDLQEEWQRLQKLQGVDAILHSHYKEDSDDPYIHDSQRKGSIVEFILPKGDYLGGPRLIFKVRNQKTDDYWLAQTLLKGLSNNVGDYTLTTVSGRILFPSIQHQTALLAIKKVNRLLQSARI